jgi:cellulose synthase/poly-beta-1,6-N-acetylglucosamine synthase-like glycosyltransferase
MSRLLLTTAIVASTSLAHAIFQRRYAMQEKKTNTAPSKELPSVDVLIAVRNEQPERLTQTLDSLLGQYPQEKLHVYIIDDASADDKRERLIPIYERYGKLENWHIKLLKKNEGKRKAQNAVFHLGNGELVLMGDSDSPFAPDAIYPMVARFQDTSIGAVAGKVDVANAEKNELTRLLTERYRLMFDVERAAQSTFGAVWTCTGPIAMYRRELLEKIWPAYINQTFNGQPCLSGDDLQLTNLVIQEGYQAIYEDKAKVWTYVPETLGEYFQQQTRWNRSMLRDARSSIVSAIARTEATNHPFPLIDTMVRTYFPFAPLIPVSTAGAHIFTHKRVRGDIATLLIMLGIRAGITYWNAKPEKVNRLRFTVEYGMIHLTLLLPARLWAYITRSSRSWGTRK